MSEKESESWGCKQLCRLGIHDKILSLDAQGMMTISMESVFSTMYNIIKQGTIRFQNLLKFTNSISRNAMLRRYKDKSTTHEPYKIINVLLNAHRE
jgi:hypothetical protein